MARIITTSVWIESIRKYWLCMDETRLFFCRTHNKTLWLRVIWRGNVTKMFLALRAFFVNLRNCDFLLLKLITVLRNKKKFKFQDFCNKLLWKQIVWKCVFIFVFAVFLSRIYVISVHDRCIHTAQCFVYCLFICFDHRRANWVINSLSIGVNRNSN